MLWYEALELLLQLMAKQDGGICTLNYSGTFGISGDYYVHLQVFGEPSKTLTTKDYSNKADAIGVALEFAQAYK